MRIVAWNCCMAWRKKRHLIELLQPDIVIVPEIAERDVAAEHCAFAHWTGRSIHKGLGVIGYRPGRYTFAAADDPGLPWFIPFTYNDLHILAVWACVASHQRRYVRLIHEALDRHDAFITPINCVIIGDFNSNAIFDRKHRLKSHSLLIERLAERGIASCYHHQSGEVQGEETMPTYFLHRSLAKPYHFDFACVSADMLSTSRLAIGTTQTFFPTSDHLPLILDLG